ncbi:hypothetical protein CONPUDRAFT_141681 [Coniophora puteana RWD-64-598 SS2]|uniref:Uncharacterized protein n=1 Tax=Coniophora puteana (strain RWD-64-598) TaxID=741705 RepID=A0A5M3N1E6_CONPW|nr:uncharacterized protein CONPUDRAFT_141681 [Coniophora puteana RWD-64-598 SS2]EIW84844.1 hypothetical protein CONPUDRAFT_141681 [Coniophora puteana RWD-64-598 SS2]
MLGVDPWWDRLALLYQHEAIRRTRATHERADLTPSERLHAQHEFEPGEIAHVTSAGGVRLAFYEFLLSQGLELRGDEPRRRAVALQHAQLTGKFALVLERLGGGRYLVCYLASYGAIRHSRSMSPVKQFFSVALGGAGARNWPPDTPAFRTRPEWKIRPGAGSGYLFVCPVVRSGLVKTTGYRRATLRMGELDRLKAAYRDRLTVFDKQHLKLRAAEEEWMKVQERYGINLDYSEPETLAALARLQPDQNDQDEVPPVESATDGANDQLPPLTPLRQRKWIPPPRLAHSKGNWNYIREPLQHIRHDLLSASPYLDRMLPLPSRIPYLPRVPFPYRRKPPGLSLYRRLVYL